MLGYRPTAVLAAALCLLGTGCEAFAPARPLGRSLRMQAASAAAVEARSPSPIGKPEETTVAVAGATGYIGKFVVKELVDQGYRTLALVRDASKLKDGDFKGAEVMEVDVCDPKALAAALDKVEGGVQGGISCLASRSGSKSDSYKVDYDATLNFVDGIRGAGASHFVLLSAYCVRFPALQFQYAKLELEAKLQEPERADLLYSIVRPTAFFKSLSGQLEVVQMGAPFVLFEKEDKSVMKCNPISEADLAEYMVGCFQKPELQNSIMDVGGPGEPISMREQGEMLFKAVGKEPKFVSVPEGLFDVIIGGLDWLAKFFPNFEDSAEFARIGKYYGVVDMVATGKGEQYGKTTLMDHYKKIAEEGQEFDPYLFGKQD